MNTWQEILKVESEKDYYKKLMESIEKEYSNYTIYPKKEELFSAFTLTPFEKVKVVILGQDPYHGENQAHGLAFSVKKGKKIPPSLKNIYKELNTDLGIPIPNHGNLVEWAKEGVLLINTILTVREKSPNSHRNLGWEIFTDNIIKSLNNRKKPLIFVLWGNNARKKQEMINMERHHVITSVHPSPLSAYRGFFGSKPFSKINKILEEEGLEKIDWNISDI